MTSQGRDDVERRDRLGQQRLVCALDLDEHITVVIVDVDVIDERTERLARRVPKFHRKRCVAIAAGIAALGAEAELFGRKIYRRLNSRLIYPVCTAARERASGYGRPSSLQSRSGARDTLPGFPPR